MNNLISNPETESPVSLISRSASIPSFAIDALNTEHSESELSNDASRSLRKVVVESETLPSIADLVSDLAATFRSSVSGNVDLNSGFHSDQVSDSALIVDSSSSVVPMIGSDNCKNRGSLLTISGTQTNPIISSVSNLDSRTLENMEQRQGSSGTEIAPTLFSASAPGIVEPDHEQYKAATSKSCSIPIVRTKTRVTLNSNCNTQLSGQIKDFSSLNKSDLHELERYANLLQPQHKDMIHSVRRKQQLYPQRYRYVEYLKASSLLLLSNGWSSGLRYSMCGAKNATNRSGLCRLHKFCSYCAFLERQKVLARYVPSYQSGVWFFLTGSFTGQLTMNGLSDYADLLHYWDSYKFALRKLVDDGLIRGVFWTEELAVNGMLPVQVLPHIHATIEASELSDTTIEEFHRLVKANLDAALGPDHLEPNIKIKNLNSQRKLLSHVQYQIKPIQIVKAYEKAWACSVYPDRTRAIALNSQLTDLVLGYSHVTTRRNKINSAGNLSIKSKPYIGTSEKRMKWAQRLVQDVMKEGVDYIELDEPENRPII